MFETWFTKSGNRHLVTALVLGMVLVSIYYPVFHFAYLYHDDWPLFLDWGSHCGPSMMGGWNQMAGRPVERFVLCALYGPLERIDQAWLARLAIVGGITAFAFLQSIYFQALGMGWTASVSLALGTSLLPGMLVFGYWIASGSIIFSLLPSAAAALLTHAALRQENGVIPRVALIVGACALQTISLLIYQTGAMYFWTLTAVMLATQFSKGLKAAVRPLAVYTLVGAVPMAAYFIWFRYLSGLAPLLRAQDPVRGTMFPGLAPIATWFFHAVLPRASALWFFDRPRGFGFAVLAVFLSSLILFSARMWSVTRRQGDRAGAFLYAAYPLVIMALGVLAFFPMLVTSFGYEVFRSLIPLSALIFLTSAVHLGVALRADRWRSAVKTGVAVSFTLGLSCLAVESLVGRMVLPAAAEYAFVRSSLLEATQNGHEAKRVHAIVPIRTRELGTDEFNSLSVQEVQDIGPMIQVIGRELGLRLGPTSYSFRGEPFDSEGALILDFAELSKSGLWKSVLGGGAVAPSSPVPMRQVVPRLPPDATDSQQPRLLSSHRDYNLVAYRGRIYGVAQSLGRLSPVDFSSGRVERLPGVIVGSTVEEVLARLPK